MPYSLDFKECDIEQRQEVPAWQCPYEGYSWLLLKACGVSQHQLIILLQPTAGRFPTNDQEFSAMILAIRRMGHILEGSTGNIAS